MNKFIKATVLSVIAAASVLPTLSTAEAGDWNRHRHHNNGDAVALGALGLATGVIIGGAIASQPRYSERVYVDPEPDYYEPRPAYRSRPVYRAQPVVVDNYGDGYGSLEPWTPSWYRYCSQRYRSFNPDNGTFRGYDGRSYFCNAG
ncbi:BA14K family protein [Ensifer sp. 4252]|uniref:BA14K family protein n=1 Tax=Ensifer sp. 4252 TaxID=3373915 RepID=UPI003D1F6243